MIYTNKCNLPKSMFDALTKNTYDLKKTDPKVISITTLINPPRIRQLSIRHWDEIEEDASEGIWRLFGSAVHSVMERINDNERFIEERLSENIDGIRVTGKTDLYEGSTKGIEDYKITSVYKVKKDTSDWEKQLNSYAWFFRKAGFPVERIHVNAILRDWRKGESKKQKDYPPFPYVKFDVPLWDMEKQEAYIKERVKIHMEASKAEDKDLPLCSEEERWCNAKKKDTRCQEYCSVRKFCSYYKEKYGGN